MAKADKRFGANGVPYVKKAVVEPVQPAVAEPVKTTEEKKNDQKQGK